MAVLPLRHFSPVEFRCKCGCGAGMEKMDADLLHLLDEARDRACPRPPTRAGMPWTSAVWIPIPVS